MINWEKFGIWLFGFVFGFMVMYAFATWSFVELIGALQIENMTIQINETELVNAVYENMPLEYYLDK